MKLATAASKITNNLNENETSHFGIRTEDMDHVKGIMRSRVYSKKELAVLREYATNAIDAHIEAGIPDKPIKITLPTLEDSTLRIRDYGRGLDESDIREIYIMYGASTKRQSNAFTGCLGIGCKAAFSYGKQFTITSWHNGKKTIWLASMDDNNHGKITKSGEALAPNEQGIEIQVPINLGDRDTFLKEAKELLPYFDVQPKCNAEIPTLTYDYEGPAWQILAKEEADNKYRSHYYYEGSPVAVMGNVPYRIEYDKMKNIPSHLSSAMQARNLILRLPLGSLEITASRESLEYTNRTNTVLISQMETTLKELSSKLQSDIDGQPNLHAAVTHATKAIQAMPASLQPGILKTLTWQDQSLPNQVKVPFDITYYSKKHSWKSDTYRNTKDEARTFKLTPDTFLCRYDAESITKTNATRRVRTLQHEHGNDPKHIFYVLPTIKEKVKVKQDAYYAPTLANSIDCSPVLPLKFLKAKQKSVKGKDWESNLHLFGKDSFIDLKDIEPMKPNRTNVKTKKGTTTKISICRLQPSSLATDQLQDIDTPQPLETGELLYIPLDRFKWNNNGPSIERQFLADYYHAIDLFEETNNLTLTKPDVDPIIHGVKRAYLDKLDDSWIPYDQWFEKQFKAFRNKYRKAYEIAITSISTSIKLNQLIPDYRVSDILDKHQYWHPALPTLINLHDFDRYSHCAIPTKDLSATHSPFKKGPQPHVIYKLLTIAMNLNLMEWPSNDTKLWDEHVQPLIDEKPLIQFLNIPYNTNAKDIQDALKSYIQSA